MRFEGREVKPYAEPIAASDLKEESVYFLVSFLDKELLIPFMEPLIFLGRNLEADDSGQLYFQDADSQRRGIRYSAGANPEATFYQYSEDTLQDVFDYEHALDRLLECSLRRQKAGASR